MSRAADKITQGALPYPQDFQKSVRKIVLLDKGTNWQLYDKTGWENAPGPGVGWWVGWVEKDGRVYAFALNMDIQKESDASKRVELGKRVSGCWEYFRSTDAAGGSKKNSN